MSQNAGYFNSTETIQSSYSSFTQGSIVFQNGLVLGQNNSNLFWDNTNLRLGIGTNTPDSTITVTQNTVIPPQIPSTTSSLHIIGSNSVPVTPLFDSFNTPVQIVMRRADGTAASPSAIQSGDILGQELFYGYGATSYQSNGAAKIVCVAAENFSDTTGAANLQFFTRPSGSTSASVSRMTIDQNGGVTVAGLASAAPVRTNSSGLLINGTIVLSAASDVSGTLPIANGGTNNNTAYTAGSIIFSNGTSLTQNNSNLFWDNTNIRLGIGTATPAVEMQIVKSVNNSIQSNLTNTNTGTNSNVQYSLTNDASNTAQLAVFGANFSATYLQNNARLGASKALWIVSDVNAASGGTDNIIFSVGGYNNITAQATTNGLTAINLTDTGIATSSAGAPLSINSSQVVIAGITNTEVNSSSNLTISTTAGTIGGATTTPAAGTYLVIFSCNISASSAGGNTLSIQMTVGGTAQADTLRKATPLSGAALATFQSMSIATNKIVTVNGSQAIAISASTSAGTVTITGLNFDVVRLA